MRYWMGLVYLAETFLNGAVLILTSLSMTDFATILTVSAHSLSNLWILKAIGSCVGILLSTWLYSSLKSENMHGCMASFVAVLGTICIVVPCFNDYLTYSSLLIFYFAIGLSLAAIDVGVCVQSRFLHGDNAGIWLSANTVSFGLGCEFVAVLQYFMPEKDIFIIVGVIAMLTAVSLVVLVNFTTPLPTIRSQPLLVKASSLSDIKTAGTTIKRPTYFFEASFGIILFFVFGVKIAASAYLHLYMESIGISHTTRKAKLLTTAVWTLCTAGRILGAYDISKLPFAIVSPVLQRNTMVLFTALLFSTLMFYGDRTYWIAMIGYFTVTGPVLGYTYDACNRITMASPTGTAYVKFGFEMGSSLMPYFTSVLWFPMGLGSSALAYLLVAAAVLPMIVNEGLRRYVHELKVAVLVEEQAKRQKLLGAS